MDLDTNPVDAAALELDDTSEAERVARWLFPASVKVTVLASAAADDPDDDFASPERHFFDVRGSCDTRQCLPRTGRPDK